MLDFIALFISLVLIMYSAYKGYSTIITILAICGLTHKEGYKDIFITSVVIPIVVTALIVAILAFGIAF